MALGKTALINWPDRFMHPTPLQPQNLFARKASIDSFVRHHDESKTLFRSQHKPLPLVLTGNRLIGAVSMALLLISDAVYIVDVAMAFRSDDGEIPL